MVNLNMFLKNVFFIVTLTGESWSENLVKNAYLLPGNVWKKHIFCLQLSAGRQERIHFIFRCVRFCEGFVGFCVGCNYPHPTIRRTLLYFEIWLDVLELAAWWSPGLARNYSDKLFLWIKGVSAATFYGRLRHWFDRKKIIASIKNSYLL